MRDGIYEVKMNRKRYYFKSIGGKTTLTCGSINEARNEMVVERPSPLQLKGKYVSPIKPFEIGDRVYDEYFCMYGKVMPLRSTDNDDNIRVCLENGRSLWYHKDGKLGFNEEDGISLFHAELQPPKNITVKNVIDHTTCDKVKTEALSYEPKYGYYGNVPTSEIKPEHVKWLTENGFLEPETVTIEGWVNVYKGGGTGGVLYETKEIAMYNRGKEAVGEPIFISHSGVVK